MRTRVRFAGCLDNPLAPGSYVLQCTVSRRRSEDAVRAVQALDGFGFIVYGTDAVPGVVSAHGETWAVHEGGAGG